MDIEQLIPIFDEIAHLQSVSAQIDLNALDSDSGIRTRDLREILNELESYGLIYSGIEDNSSPIIFTAGEQFLQMSGAVDPDVLRFLPTTIDDLHARAALLTCGLVLIDSFAAEISEGMGAEFARDLVPVAFTAAVDERMAVDLFAAASALMARLSAELPAACLAEEIIAVELVSQATAHIETANESGSIDAEQCARAIAELQALYELFEDDDVLRLFEMQEPADAPVVGDTFEALQKGVADLRTESWFKRFNNVPVTGHLRN